MKGFRDQYLECKESGNCFIIEWDEIYKWGCSVIVCVKHKTHCHSGACFDERKEKE